VQPSSPTFVLLGVWMVYPAIYTIIRSFYGIPEPTKFVGFDNYKAIFQTSTLVTAIKNNAIWVAVVPALTTAIGLIFAVLTERISWSVAFKTAVFLPMAISAFATGVTWRIMYQQEPSEGAINALGRVAVDTGAEARRSAERLSVDAEGRPDQGRWARAQDAAPGGRRRPARRDGHRPDRRPEGAVQAVTPASTPGSIVGVVWRDFSPAAASPARWNHRSSSACPA
jgi:hypothetical protein